MWSSKTFLQLTHECPPPILFFFLELNFVVLKMFWRHSLLLDLWQWSRNSQAHHHEHRCFLPLETIFSLSLSSYVTLHFQSGAAAGESLCFWSAGLASGLFASTDLQCLGEQFLSSHCCMSLIRILTKPRVQMILITFHYGPAGPGILMCSVTSSEDAPAKLK